MEFSNYGFIMIDPSYTEEQSTALKANGFTTTVYCVQDINMACKAAKKLQDKRVHLIELCGAFNDEMVTQIIEAVDGKVPVGNIAMRPEESEKFMSFLNKEPSLT
ncbi:DUF6506 family protein [Tenacibaculum maritimum]|uniref:DUF6506 family protein n=1 Tax=Tenacibaculum maritimum TaxID=107401 RepID=UPI0012E645D2|nr:DUF6506 family protein [Tenacibaculum maritimum]CAA0245190.1 conserved hypothetical protein [Tenacibaculum maritimum]